MCQTICTGGRRRALPSPPCSWASSAGRSCHVDCDISLSWKSWSWLLHGSNSQHYSVTLLGSSSLFIFLEIEDQGIVKSSNLKDLYCFCGVYTGAYSWRQFGLWAVIFPSWTSLHSQVKKKNGLYLGGLKFTSTMLLYPLSYNKSPEWSSTDAGTSTLQFAVEIAKTRTQHNFWCMNTHYWVLHLSPVDGL